MGNAFCISFTALVSGKGLANANTSSSRYYLVIMGGGGSADPTCPSNDILLTQAQGAITGASYVIQNTTIRFQCGRNGFGCDVIAALCCQTSDACNTIQIEPESPNPVSPGLPPSTSIAVGVILGTALLVAIAGGIYWFVLWKRKAGKTSRAEIYGATSAYHQAPLQI